MRRRVFVKFWGGAAAISLTARAQQRRTPVIGLLSARTEASGAPMAAAFRQGLSESGYVEGKNLQIEYRWAEGHYDRLRALANDLVRRQVEVIAALSGTPAALAAKTATTTIPIVFGNGGDPLASGLVASLNRPPGNITGVTFYTVALAGKRIGLLRELVPAAAIIGLFTNPNNPAEESERKDAEAAARSLGVRLHVLDIISEHDIDAAFITLNERRVGALVVGSDPLFFGLPHKVVELAARHAMPTIYIGREFPEAGGLMSYGSKQSEAYRQAGIYVARILQGVRPADLPVMLPTKFELVINVKTAKALGLTIPAQLRARTDAIIE